VRKKFNCEQKYLNSGLETQNEQELNIDLIFNNNLYLAKVHIMKTPWKEFTIEPERNSLKLTSWNG